jgi:RNA polymerase sigma-70 factor (ECF subfamily)
LTPKILPSDLVEHRPYLVKFAVLQVGQKEVAEDLVQEVLLAAIRGLDGFSGRSSLRTWLTAILLNKIADHRRGAARQVSIEAQEEAHGADSIEAMFQANGTYISMPREWRDPQDSLTDKRFFEALESCLSHLSEVGRRVFLLREMMGLSVEEICKELGLSASNCSVLLHRGRMRLRSCLEGGWFAKRQKR